MRRVLIACAGAHPEVLRSPAPRVFLREFGEHAFTFELWAYIHIRDVAVKVRTESDLRHAIAQAFRAAGCDLCCLSWELRQ